MKKTLFAALVMLIVGSSAFAQTPVQTVTVGKAFAVAATHDGAFTDGYRVYIDGQKVGSDIAVTALASGTVTVGNFTVSTIGPHTIILAAFNASIETQSAPLDFTAQPPAPTAPTNLRLIVEITQQADGTLKLSVVGVEAR